jgi:type II secretory pathway component PulF
MNETSPIQKPSLAITILLLILSLALYLAWIGQMVLVIPEYERMYAEFRIRAPAVTEATFNYSRFVANFWYILVFFALFIAYPAIGYFSYYLRHRCNRCVLRRFWFVLIICSPLVVQTITFLSVLIPIYRIDGIHGRR